MKLSIQLQAKKEQFINIFHEHCFSDAGSMNSLDPVIPFLISVTYLLPLKDSKQHSIFLLQSNITTGQVGGNKN